ncbi:DUF2283 domain-containing protein [Methanobrevibacter sp. DSM 116169]|uniref:DUF2283 domain-containing protein n=1 Tax=Methanobrevibacter sp. DSM 116169 TaxID=3242727 RepID=UPI0038FC21B8
MTEMEKVFSDERIKKINKSLREKQEFLENNPDEMDKFIKSKAKSDAEGFEKYLKEAYPRKSFQTHNHDYKNDVFKISNEKYEIDFNLKIDENIFLDFNEYGVPVSIRILNASEVFGIKKVQMKNLLRFHMHLFINEKIIGINGLFEFNFHNKKESFELTPLITNDMNLPNYNRSFDLANA